MAKTPKELGLGDDHVDFLTHHAHQFHGPTDFDDEVQKHLDKLYGKNDSEQVPPDWEPSPEDRYEESQKSEQDAIQNISEGSPPSIPSPASRMPMIP